MKALVLAAGKGTRLRPLTYAIPKHLIPVANRPIIFHVMDRIHEAGIRQVGVVVSPDTAEQFKAALSENPWGFDLGFVYQDEPRGLADAVRVSREFLDDEPFVLFLGDNLLGRGIDGMIGDFMASKSDALLLLKEVEDPSRFGVAVRSEDGSIVRLVEKPREPVSNLAIVGAYAFSPAVHAAVERIDPSWRGELEITDAIQSLLDTGHEVKGRILDSWWLDCGKKDDLLEANRVLLEQRGEGEIQGEVDSASQISGNVTVEKGATVLASQIKGPAIVGAEALIQGSDIGPYASIGPRCAVSGSAVQNSILLSGARIEGTGRLVESVVGRNAVVRSAIRGLEPLTLMIGDESEVLLNAGSG